MARFDVYQIDKESVSHVLDVQADILGGLHSVVVIPLVPENVAKQEALERLKPVVDIKGKNFILMTTDIGVLPRTKLEKKVTNIGDEYHHIVMNAIDFLFQGF